VCRPFSRYKNFHKGVERFQRSLRTQKMLYINSCLLLLRHITDQENATQILNSSSKINEELKEALANALGSSGEACMEIIQNIGETLQKIHEEKFWELENQDGRPSSEDKVVEFSCPSSSDAYLLAGGIEVLAASTRKSKV
jgi:type IV secretory pathway VirB4 component